MNSKTTIRKLKNTTASKHPLWTYIKRNWVLYCFVLPGILMMIIFNYLPLFGIQIAFRDYNQALGFFRSPWVGMKHFMRFINSPRFSSIIRNTIHTSLATMLFTFPLPIIFAMFLNQIVSLRYKKLIQTVTYMPYFISMVVLVGMIKMILSPTSGIVNSVIKLLGKEPINFMSEPQYFLKIYIISAIWQTTGWSAIIYLAALTAVPRELHEAAIVDGASKMRRILHIDIPCILPTIVIQFIMAIGNIMSVGFEKIFLLQNPLNLETTEVISTYVYKMGIINHQYSFSTAINLFNSVINLVLLLICNKICKKISNISLF